MSEKIEWKDVAIGQRFICNPLDTTIRTKTSPTHYFNEQDKRTYGSHLVEKSITSIVKSLVKSNVEQIVEERGKNYGDFREGAAIMCALKSAARAEPSNWKKMPPSHKEAMDMILHKMARLLNGNPDHLDSWVDIQGYAKLVEDIIRENERGSLSDS